MQVFFHQQSFARFGNLVNFIINLFVYHSLDMSAHWHCSTEQASLCSYAHQHYLLKEPMRISTSKIAVDHFTSGYWIAISDLQWHYIHYQIPSEFMNSLLPQATSANFQRFDLTTTLQPNLWEGSPHDVSPSSLSVGWSWSLGNFATVSASKFIVFWMVKTAWHLKTGGPQ